MVHYSLQPGAYDSNSFYFYAGLCMGNDGGSHLSNGDQCSDSDIENLAGRWDTFPLIEESGALMNEFTFQQGDQSTGVWPQDYQVFPVGSNCRSFMTAYAKVCIAGTPSAPVSEPVISAAGSTVPDAGVGSLKPV
jgi:hypothetical protein